MQQIEGGKVRPASDVTKSLSKRKKPF
jgi:hypothetical protein